MLQLNSAELKRLSSFLKKYDAKSTTAQLGGLLTVPSFQANTIRIETLVHLAVAHCQGHRKPGSKEMGHWFNRYLGETQIASFEDPVEDVFITNVETAEGNRRVFEGVWESNDYFVQIVIDILGNRKAPQKCKDFLVPALALLRMSECVAERSGLCRWYSEPSNPMGKVKLTPAMRVADRANAITFTDSDLEELGFNRDVLEPFILREEDKQNLTAEIIGNTSLERRPIVDFGGELVLALPTSVSPAIRRYAITELQRIDYLSAFSSVLATRQARQVEHDGLWELKGESESLEPPEHDGVVPALHSWLLRYDFNKYIHVVLLHDRFDWLDAQGLSGSLKYPEGMGKGLDEYLDKVSRHCQSLPDFSEGASLLVMGGLGRGFTLRYGDRSDQWRFSAIRVPDLLMLANEINRPITRYLKCIKQKEWAEGKGVHFMNINGDYNFFCFWRRLVYQLVPRDLAVNDGSVLNIGTDMVQPVREEVRNLVDRHVLQTVGGPYISVIRQSMDSYFKSMQSRPIYVSLRHIRNRVLIGAIETSRGPSWLTVMPREGDEQIQHFLYEIWSGFIGLFDRLVFEFEDLYPNISQGPVEVRLDFSKIVLHEDYVDIQPDTSIADPEIVVNLEQRIATIKFPSDFLIHFQQPEDTGEKLILQSIARSLNGLYQEVTGVIDDVVLDTLVRKVCGVSGVRIIHLFHTHYPIEHLLSQQSLKPVFLAQEDFVFSKLNLYKGCTKALPGTSIASRLRCNEFLHRIVDKIWNQLRERLQQFDRASVISEMLKVHEAVIQDRDRWSRTAQAVLAIHASTDDVYTVAQEREWERNNVSLPARTIVEMAVCECPDVGGARITRWDSDELLAKAALLVEVATDSDAISSDLIKPRIYLHPNGEYTIDRSYRDTIVKPFLKAYFQEEYESAAKDYGKSYKSEPPGERKRADEVFSSEFIDAFRAEFGLTPDEAVDGFAELMDLAVERNSVVVETTLGNLKTRLIKSRGLSPEVSEAFLSTFSIIHRTSWDKPPPGFRDKDLYPWRFRRRLSATARPIFVFGRQDDDKAFFGAGAFKLGFGYLLGKSETGHLPQEFFVSTEMKQYIGTVNSERGHAFARTVAESLREKGWQARNEVQMTELGGSATLGDIDVLVWKPSGEIQIIECKRLQLARTVAEVAEICRRFRGDAKDELDKHIQRVNWINANSERLQGIVGFVPDPARIDDKLVTNTHVPMMYLTSLPIKSDKIGPLK